MVKAAKADAAHLSSTTFEGHKASCVSEDIKAALAHGFMVLTQAKPPLKI